MQRIGAGGIILAIAFVMALGVAFLNYQDRGLQPQQWPQAVQHKIAK